MCRFNPKIIIFAAIMVSGAVLRAQEFFLPSTIYVRADEPSRTVLYPEGFVASRGQSLLLDGAASFPVDLTKPFVEVQYEGGSVSVPLKLVPVDASGLEGISPKRVLCLGESTTAMRCRNPFDASSKAGNWVMLAREQLPSSVRLVGDVGHGGWATYTYLNWPCAAKLDPNTPPSFFKPATMWYALGLAGKSGCEFNGSREQLSEMALTPFGRYPMDGNAELWKLLQLLGKRDAYPPFDRTEEYDGSKAQIAAMRAWADELMANPINEFYDGEKARKDACAFSLETYLRRSGQRKPDAVVINLGINDADGANSIESSLLCFRRLLECFGNIPLAHYVNRWPGVCDKALWPGFLPRQYDFNGNTANLLRLQRGWREIADSKPEWFELDVWHLQYPASQLEEKMTPEGLDCSRNDVHTGYMGIKSTADQIVNWLIYIFRRDFRK